MIEVADVQDSQNPIAFPEMRKLNDGFGLQSIPLTKQMRRESHFDEIVGESEALRRVLGQVETVASRDSTELIYGETGTGRELIARAVHNLSPRKSRAFVKLNCAAIPTGLLKSELSDMRKARLHRRRHPAGGEGQHSPNKTYALLVNAGRNSLDGTCSGLVSWNGCELTQYRELDELFVT